MVQMRTEVYQRKLFDFHVSWCPNRQGVYEETSMM